MSGRPDGMTRRPEAPGPLMRRGPRPLLLHLTLAMLRSNVSRATSPLWNADWPTSNVAAVLQSIQSAVRDGNLEGSFPAEVWLETLEQDAALIEGIAAYRRHPLAPRPWPIRLRSGRKAIRGCWITAFAGAQPVLFVPSLINRAYVLDLAEGSSMLRWLAGQGVRPLLLDWGWPGETERRFTLTDYVAGRLERAMAAAARSPE